MEPCPHRPPCPGCPRYGERGLAPAVQARLAALAAAHGLPLPPLIEGPAWGFRHRARLAVRAVAGRVVAGLFEAGSHQLVPVPGCRVHHPLINRVAVAFGEAMQGAACSAWDEQRLVGLVRYLQVVVERESQSAQVVVVANADDPQTIAPLAAGLQQRLGVALHSLWFNEQRSRSNVILGPRFVRLSGPEAVVERFGGAAVHYPPGAFGQGNLPLAKRLVADACALVPDGARVAEYHAGTGAIGLTLVHRAASVWFNEVGEHSLAGLALGLAALPEGQRARCTVAAGAARARCADAPDADVVIVDPPRKGLEPALLAHFVARPPARLIYMSCGLDALERDLHGLVAGGRMRLASLAAYDLMPHTGHVEALACLEGA